MTDEITKRILPLRDFRRGNDMLFELCESGGRCPAPWLSAWRDEIQEQEDIRTTVNAVVELISQSGHPLEVAKRPLTYEDVVHALDRLWRLESGRAFDPLAAVTLMNLRDRLSLHPRLLKMLRQTLGDSINCLRDMVSKELTVEDPPSTHLKFFSELIERIGPSNLIVVTTNHDTLLEQHLKRESRPVECGFTIPADEYDIPRWTPQLLDGEQESLRLLKVHGSIDWH